MQSKNFKTKPVQVLSDDLKDRMPFRLRSYLFAGVVLSATLCSIAFGDETAPKIERILCEGNARTRCDVLIAQTLLAPGEVLDDSKVSESRDRLRLSGNYKEADIRLSKGSSPGLVDLTVFVEERSSLLALGSLVYLGGPAEKYSAADITLADTNLTGHRDSLAIRFRDSTSGYQSDFKHNELLGSLEYIRPSFLTSRMYLVSGLGVGRTSSAYVNSGMYGYSPYDEHLSRTWAYLLLGYKTSDYCSFSLGYRKTLFLGDNTPRSYLYDGTHFYFDRAKNFGTWFVQYARDSQDNANFPTEGSRLELTYEQSSSSVYSADVRIYAAGLFHFKLSERDILSLKIGRFVGNDSNFNRAEDSGLSLRYSNYFRRHQESSAIQNASVYVEPGFFGGDGGPYPGLKTGVSFQTKYGIINLFLAVTH